MKDLRLYEYHAFKEEYKKHHTCGIEAGLPGYLAFDSACPRCCPEGPQWEAECNNAYMEGRFFCVLGWWYTKDDLEKMGIKI